MQELETFLGRTAEDLGFEVGLAAAEPREESEVAPSEEEPTQPMLETSLRSAGPSLRVLRLRLRAPGLSPQVFESAPTSPEELEVRAALLLREALRTLEAKGPQAALAEADARLSGGRSGPRSPGRVALGLHAAAYGALVGYSLQRGSGSDDARLLLPLLVGGAGMGLGAALVASDEWEVGTADAWYLASGAWWPTLSAHMLLSARAESLSLGELSAADRWSWGLLGGGVGLPLATLGLTRAPMSEGGALLAHSAPAWGLVEGGLLEMALEGKVAQLPREGVGWGTAVGWSLAAAVASQTPVEPGLIHVLDLGFLFGGAGAAALASPLLLGEPSPARQRAFALTAGAGALVGSGGAVWMVVKIVEKMSAVPPAPSPRALAWVDGLEPTWVGGFAAPAEGVGAGGLGGGGRLGAGGPGLMLRGSLR